MATKIDIGGELNPRTVEGIVADASTIIDRTAEKRQDEINSEVSESLEGKQDAIEDLSAIRSGAAAGATSVQPVDIEHMVEAEPIGSIVSPVNPSEFATKEEMREIESVLEGKATIQMTSGAYINLSMSQGQPVPVDSPTANASFSYGIMDAAEGDVFIINGTGAWSPRLWGFVDSNNNRLTVADANASGVNLEIVAPENSAKIIVNSSSAGVSYKIIGESIPQKYATKTEVTSLGARVTHIENTTPEMEWVCRNLWDGETLLSGYISSSKIRQGETILISSSSTSNYIKLPIQANTDYTVSAKTNLSYVAITNADGILLSDVDARANLKVKVVSGKANAAFIYVQNIMNDTPAEDLQIEEGTAATEYDEGHWSIKAENLPGSIDQSPLYGKKVAFFGDSICANTYGWATPIANMFGVEAINLGVSGSTIHDRLISGVMSSIRIAFENYAQNDPADMYILSGGFNDSVSDFGSMAEGYPEAGTFDTTNAVQSLEDICAYISEHLIGKRVGFIIHYYYSNVSTWDIKANKLIEVLEKWSIPYLDLRKCATFGLNNAVRRSIYGADLKSGIPNYDPAASYVLDQKVVYNGAVYKANEPLSPAGEWDATKWTLTGDSNGYDNMHCNKTAYDILGRIIGEWMKTL